MRLFMDIHRLDGATVEAVAQAHLADVKCQERHHVNYVKYWFNESAGKVFCLVEAPDAEAAIAVHKEAHGLVADEIIEVESQSVHGFLGPGPANSNGAALAPGSDAVLDGGFRAVLFTDIEGSTTLTQKLGDTEALKVIREHDAIVRKALDTHSGRQVKHTGDGIMAAFVSAVAAVKCAIEAQKELALYNRDHPSQPIRIRIGISAGEPVEDREDLFGAAVQLAARACAWAQPGQIRVSNVVAGLCIGKSLTFVDLGGVPLKGFDNPVPLHEVRWLSA
jgi:class 3 adenylate cyclase